MSLPKAPKPAKLVIGLFMKEKLLLDKIATELIDLFGSIDTVSSWFSFDYTDYYEPEMNAPLFRRMLTFKELVRQSALAEIKMLTNDIESNYSREKRRRVNIDPGYMLKERFVLATGKTTSVRDMVQKAFSVLGIEIRFEGTGGEEKGIVEKCTSEYHVEPGSVVVQVDPRYYRPTEVDLLIGDSSKAQKELGWKFEYTFDDLIEEMVNSDVELFKRDKYLQEGGHEIKNYFE